jgi:hypothetical protein
MMKFMRENNSEIALARRTTSVSLSSSFSSTFFPLSYTSMMASRSSRIYPLPAMIPTPSCDIFSSTSVLDEYYNDIGSILDFPTYEYASNGLAFSTTMDETTESAMPFNVYPIKSELDRTPSHHWNGPTKTNDQESPPIKVQSSTKSAIKPTPKKRRRHRTTSKSTPEATPPIKRRRTIKESAKEDPPTPKTMNRPKVDDVQEKEAPRLESNDSPDEPTELLDQWQKQFLNFLTYPSDHIFEATGQLVPFKETIIWGRQKVLWTAPLAETESKGSDKKSASSSSTISGKSKTKWVNLSSKSGGNHLSQQLVVQAATAAASASSSDSNAAKNFIRRTKDQALWFHGNDQINQKLGLWLQQERRSYQATVGGKVTNPLLERLTAKKPPHCRTASKTHPEKAHQRRLPLKEGKLNDFEKEALYGQLQQSFRFELMKLCGIDMQNVLPDDTLFPRKQNLPFAKMNKK